MAVVCNALDFDGFWVPWRRRSVADGLAEAGSYFLLARSNSIDEVVPLHVIRKTNQYSVSPILLPFVFAGLLLNAWCLTLVRASSAAAHIYLTRDRVKPICMFKTINNDDTLKA